VAHIVQPDVVGTMPGQIEYLEFQPVQIQDLAIHERRHVHSEMLECALVIKDLIPGLVFQVGKTLLGGQHRDPVALFFCFPAQRWRSLRVIKVGMGQDEHVWGKGAHRVQRLEDALGLGTRTRVDEARLARPQQV
jgi:hypothetical protein